MILEIKVLQKHTVMNEAKFGFLKQPFWNMNKPERLERVFQLS